MNVRQMMATGALIEIHVNHKTVALENLGYRFPKV